jgi:hypothetical protein
MRKLLLIVGLVLALAAGGCEAYQYCCGLPPCPEPPGCTDSGK